MKSDFGSETCRPGVKSGEATIREVAAYLLDNQTGSGFSSVPRTTLVEMSHECFINNTIHERDIISPEHLELLQGLAKFESD